MAKEATKQNMDKLVDFIKRIDNNDVFPIDSPDSVYWLCKAISCALSDAITSKLENNFLDYEKQLQLSVDYLTKAADCAKQETQRNDVAGDLPNVTELFAFSPRIEPWATLIENKITKEKEKYGGEYAEAFASGFLKEFRTLRTNFGFEESADFDTINSIATLKKIFKNMLFMLNYEEDSASATYQSMILDFAPYLCNFKIDQNK